MQKDLRLRLFPNGRPRGKIQIGIKSRIDKYSRHDPVYVGPRTPSVPNQSHRYYRGPYDEGRKTELRTTLPVIFLTQIFVIPVGKACPKLRSYTHSYK